MQKKIIVIVFLLIFSSFCLLPILAVNNNNHIIVGYGPIEGELFAPKSIAVFKEKLFVLDQFGVSAFNVANNQFLYKFPVKFVRENTETRELQNETIEDPNYWKELLTDTSSKRLLENIVPSGSGDIWSLNSQTFKTDICIDSNGLLYILSFGIINVYNPENGEFLYSIPIPKNEFETNIEGTGYQFTFKIYEDSIYLLRYFLNVRNLASNSLYVFKISLKGLVEDKIKINYDSNKIMPNPDDFVYLPDIQLFGISGFELNNNDSIYLYLFDTKGIETKTITSIGRIMPESFDYSSPNTIFMHAVEIKDNKNYPKILILKYKQEENGVVELSRNAEIQNDAFNETSLDLITTQDSFFILLNNVATSPFNTKVLSFRNEILQQYGSISDKEGQVFGSLAFSIDEYGNIFQSNLTNNTINQFSQKGSIISTTKLDPSQAKLINNGFPIRIQSLFIDKNQDIYCTSSYISNFLFRYRTQEKQWEKVASESNRSLFCYDLQKYNNTFYFLDTRMSKNKTPVLLFLSSDENSKYVFSEVSLKNSPRSLKKDEFIFTGFVINNSEIQFLESTNSEIWIYDAENGRYKEKVVLPQDKKSFYSSFDLYPDGTWIVTDATQHRLLHITRTGQVLEVIGSKGQIEIGTSKEAYLEKSNQFYIPIRVKIANNKIYVSDFGNCRYHIIPIEPLTMTWQEESINMESISIFGNETGALHYVTSISSVLPYQVTSTVPWIAILTPEGTLGDNKIDYQFLGEQLIPWKLNIGEIQITFPGYSFLNHTIPVTVYAVGSTVELTIGSNQAKTDSKFITLEAGYIPVIKQGRTCIGLRFLTEYLFRTHATIEYDNKIQGITVKLKNHLIYMIINKAEAIVDGKSVTLDVPPFIQQGRTMIPLRFVSESLEAEVSWEASTRKVTITYPIHGLKNVSKFLSP